ncbi:uncharacterized protein LOC108601522 [Drosophila busckii]|nr:uncharacterized protein LOC108601522 [Drosophila busckii]
MRCLLLLGLLLPTVLGNRSELRPALERVFSRQKRFVLFPKGSNLKFTGSISKGLLSKFPKGINMNIEQAVYYPVPSSREDVYPKRFRPRTTTTPQPLTTTEPLFVWIPGTDWRFKATPVKKPMPLRLHAQQRIDYRPSKQQQQKWASYGQRYGNWTSKQKYAQRWQKWSTPAPKWQQQHNKRWYRAADATDYAASNDEDLEHLRQTPHYHGYRDRRQLFEHWSAFSKLLGFDTKSCILRAICDSKRLLLPPGYSMLQDILRLIFTLPTVSGVQDDYSRLMHMSPEQCDQRFRQQCKLDLLAWLLLGQSH